MKMMRRPPATAMLMMAGRLSGLSGAMYTIPGEYSMPPTRACGHREERGGSRADWGRVLSQKGNVIVGEKPPIHTPHQKNRRETMDSRDHPSARKCAHLSLRRTQSS